MPVFENCPPKSPPKSALRFASYTKAKSNAAVVCGKCGGVRHMKAGEMFMRVEGRTVLGCCMSPHQTKLAQSLKAPPRSALTLQPAKPGEFTGTTPKEIMAGK